MLVLIRLLIAMHNIGKRFCFLILREHIYNQILLEEFPEFKEHIIVQYTLSLIKNHMIINFSGCSIQNNP